MTVSLEDAKNGLTITDVGHILLGKVGAPFPDLSKFVFGDKSTYGGFDWFGDTSAENLPEFEADGGDVSPKRTFDRKGMRNVREDKAYTGTFNSVVRNREFFEKTQGGGEWDDTLKGYITKANSYAMDWAMLIVEEDGSYISGLGLYNVSLLSGFATYDLEEFKEVPVEVAVGADAQGRVKIDFEPRLKAKPGSPAPSSPRG